MANAKLHVICGNCGEDNDFKLSIDHVGASLGENDEDDVYLKCLSCSTLHPLLDRFPPEADNVRQY
jgi:hypothetical protein